MAHTCHKRLASFADVHIDRPAGAGEQTSDSARRLALGRRGEQLAATHLARRGFETLARNVRTRDGEIDVIAFDGHVLVFVEVKTLRAGGAAGARAIDPLAGLRRGQQARLRRLASAWLSSPAARPRARVIRFDAIGVVLDGRGSLLRLDHVEGAW